MIEDLSVVLCGTGTSSGIPIIGCRCAVCSSEDPRDRRTRCGACIRFRDAGGRPRMILLDCPPDHREHALRLGLDRCDTILLTHAHVDHVFGLDDVRRYNAVQRSSIELLAEPETMEAVERMFRHVFRAHENINPSFVAQIQPGPLAPGLPVDRFGLRFEPIRLLHGRLPILGFRIEALDGEARVAEIQPPPFPLAYCTDVSAIPPETWPRLQGLRTLVLDLLRPRSHPTHFTVDQAVEAASRIEAERTWFLHMSHEIRHAELDPTLPAGMRLAWDGVRL
ncbi:MAG: MBL fold metallo-hydrolase [Planctomycetota bacterium]|nr:MBL fold metallo-hydrolase [Planctomycetota bacterium]